MRKLFRMSLVAAVVLMVGVTSGCGGASGDLSNLEEFSLGEQPLTSAEDNLRGGDLVSGQGNPKLDPYMSIQKKIDNEKLEAFKEAGEEGVVDSRH